MGLYKCISCGEIKESEESCSCPYCGCRMFASPYDRKEVLENEIKRFISCLEVTSVVKKDLVFKGKGKDDCRFPGYDKILKYVTGRDRTEDFKNNLFETVEQLKKHFSTDFSKIYPVKFDHLDSIIAQYDEVLKASALVLKPDINVDMPSVEWPEVSLLYAEKQNKYLWVSASELIDSLEKLVSKIVRFIKVYNLFGDAHKYYPAKRSDIFAKETDYKEAIEDAIAETETIFQKKYIIDIEDDGVEELKEMLTCLWHGIELIMCTPLFISSYDYLTEAGTISENDFFDELSDLLKGRYGVINSCLSLESLLESKSEMEIFDIYRKLIELDKFGFLVPIGTTLIHIGKSETKLNELIGLSEIKESIRKIKAYALANKDSENLNVHMCFLGNPGSGKTEVARLIAEILYENKILPTKNIVEVDRSGLVSEYFGATAEKTQRVISRAMGGVLFVDEAYALGKNFDGGATDYGKEAIDTLVKAMEDFRGQFCVIFAGYRNEMMQMLSTNPGFASRIQFTLDFPNYSRDELRAIAELMLKKRNYIIGDAALERILDITDFRRKDPNFANARELRNILDQVIMCQNVRCAESGERELGLVDVEKYIQDAKISLSVVGEGVNKKILSCEEEFDLLVGLSSVKRMVKKIKAYARRNLGEPDFNLHMCFYGNPGTGKTEVARLISRILYEAGVLGEAKCIEIDAHGLLGKYVGETAPKTEAKIKEAMNGVLFIDEAYCLSGSAAGGAVNYGDEAIAVLLKAMEDRRGQFCVILAGYKAEMEQMLQSNPGFASRIQFTLDFPDYTREELGEIARVFLAKKKYDIEQTALERILDIAEYYKKRPNFSNARTVRNILDQVILNQNVRADDDLEDRLLILDDVEGYITDERIDLSVSSTGRRPIGF